MKASAQTLSVSGPSLNKQKQKTLAYQHYIQVTKCKRLIMTKLTHYTKQPLQVSLHQWTIPIPSKGPSQFPSIQTLDNRVNGVRKQLEALKPHKASGPDEIPARV